jgi:hypothetical protein
MNAIALFLEPPGKFETRELQPLPDASEAAWDRWMLEISGPDFFSWRAACPPSAPKPSAEGQLRACMADE